MASTPEASASMAVNEEGQDLPYFSVMHFGSEGKKLWMLVDSGAADTWVMGSECTTSACRSHTTFGSLDSTTLTDTRQSWSVMYGTGTVGGTIVADTVAFAGFSVGLQFGPASNTSDDFNSYPMDGILGLGRPGSNNLRTPTLMQVLANQKLLKANFFGVHLQRNGDGANNGQITFGEVDNSKFDNELTYTNTVSSDSIWEIPADGAGVNGVSCNFTGKTGVIDTGTSYILMPPPNLFCLLLARFLRLGLPQI